MKGGGDLAQTSPGSLLLLTRRIQRRIVTAREAGLDDEGIMDVVRAALRQNETQASA
jgi:hypothetical protein